MDPGLGKAISAIAFNPVLWACIGFVGLMVYLGLKDGGTVPGEAMAITVIEDLIRDGHREDLRSFMMSGYSASELEVINPYVYQRFVEAGLLPVTEMTKNDIELML